MPTCYQFESKSYQPAYGYAIYYIEFNLVTSTYIAPFFAELLLKHYSLGCDQCPSSTTTRRYQCAEHLLWTLIRCFQFYLTKYFSMDVIYVPIILLVAISDVAHNKLTMVHSPSVFCYNDGFSLSYLHLLFYVRFSCLHERTILTTILLLLPFNMLYRYIELSGTCNYKIITVYLLHVLLCYQINTPGTHKLILYFCLFVCYTEIFYGTDTANIFTNLINSYLLLILEVIVIFRCFYSEYNYTQTDLLWCNITPKL